MNPAVLWPGTTDARPVPGSHRVISVLLKTVVALLFIVSGGMLWELGLNYDGISGAPASKIHPATYVTVFTFVLFVLARRHPGSLMPKLISRHPGSLVFLVATCAVLLFVVVSRRPGPAGLVDTFILPVLLVWILAEQSSGAIRGLETMIHWLLTCNALLVLAEFIGGIQLFPYRFEGELLIDIRPNGFNGHPLTNAVVTGTYIAALLGGGGSQLSWSLRGALILLQCAALAASGGRTAIVLISAMTAFYLLRHAFGLLTGRRLDLGCWAACAVALPLIAVGFVALNASGFLDAALARFNYDDGSAQARMQMFEMFSYLPIRDVLIAPDVEMVNSVRPTQGLDLGIENPIIRFVLYQGVLATAALVIGFVLFIREFVQTLRKGYGLPLIFFLSTIMSFESLSSKSTLLAKFVILLTVMFRREPMFWFGALTCVDGRPSARHQYLAAVRGEPPGVPAT